ncbi:E3 ubiquitin-protein ligase pub1, partial [Stylosanthes scabra]|nr:E3 ubiquitin-protein ligase pub1 [Stylosanthes scabra]
DGGNEGYNEESKKESSSYLYNKVNDSSSPSQSMSMIATNVPDEFRCPISLDLMRDPVIVSSGHTYNRNSIAQWINSGYHTCPKSGQRLIHTALIPNYAVCTEKSCSAMVP